MCQNLFKYSLLYCIRFDILVSNYIRCSDLAWHFMHPLPSFFPTLYLPSLLSSVTFSLLSMLFFICLSSLPLSLPPLHSPCLLLFFIHLTPIGPSPSFSPLFFLFCPLKPTLLPPHLSLCLSLSPSIDLPGSVAKRQQQSECCKGYSRWMGSFSSSEKEVKIGRGLIISPLFFSSLLLSLCFNYVCYKWTLDNIRGTVSDRCSLGRFRLHFPMWFCRQVGNCLYYRRGDSGEVTLKHDDFAYAEKLFLGIQYPFVHVK